MSWQQHESPALDLATGQSRKLRLPSKVENCSHLLFSPDGRTLLLSCLDDVIVWDYRKSEQRRVLKRAGEPAVFTPDGKHVVTNNGSLQCWDLATGNTVWPDTFAWGHVDEVTALVFSADGRRLLSGSPDGSVRLWEAETGRPLQVWNEYRRPAGLPGGAGAPSGVSALALTPNGSQLLCAGLGGILQLHDTISGKLLHKLPLPSDDFLEGPPYAYDIRISRDGSQAIGLVGAEFFRDIVGHEKDKRSHRLITWDLKSGRLLASRDVPINARVLSPDGGVVISANGALLDAETAKEIVHIQEMPLRSPQKFSPDGSLIVSRFNRLTRTKEGQTAYNMDGACIWETATGKPVAHVKRNDWVTEAYFHPNNRFVVFNNLDGVELWDLLRGEKVAVRKMPERVRAGNTRDSSACCLAFAPDGRRLATGMPDGTILLWDISLPVSNPQRLEAKEAESLWTDLADTDAAKAWRAVWRLADGPQDALAFLRGRVKPYPTAPVDVTRKLLADLDSDSFEAREAVGKRLKELGLQAEPALRAALEAKPSLEQRKRIEPLLAALAETTEKPSAEELRQLRALIVLERIASPEARRILEDVAKGPQSARLTRQAQAALECLR